VAIPSGRCEKIDSPPLKPRVEQFTENQILRALVREPVIRPLEQEWIGKLEADVKHELPHSHTPPERLALGYVLLDADDAIESLQALKMEKEQAVFHLGLF
jgi:hypothetical protein